MNATTNSEYQKLALDSSNELMDHDADRALGRYAKAALHAREAGRGRLRMGEMMRDEGNFTQAAADWLSAAACFYLATDLTRLRDAFERVQKLGQEGKIPPERGDLHAALKEGEEQINTLERKLSQFRQDYGRLVGSIRAGSQDALDFLLRQVRELPGSSKLHAEISHQARQLGKRQLAVEYLDWAQNFDSQSPHLAALRVSLLIASGELHRAIRMGRELLRTHPALDHVRILLAQALGSQTEARRTDWEEAVELLTPLTESGSSDVEGQLLALALAAILRHGLGHNTKYRQVLDSFNQLAYTLQNPPEKDVVSKLRDALPQVFLPPSANGAATSANGEHQPLAALDPAVVRRVFEQFSLSAA